MLTNPAPFSMPLTLETSGAAKGEPWVFEPEHSSNGRLVRKRRQYLPLHSYEVDLDANGNETLSQLWVNTSGGGVQPQSVTTRPFSANAFAHPKSWVFITHAGQRYFHHPDYELYPSVEEGGWFQHKDVVAKLKAEKAATAKKTA